MADDQTPTGEITQRFRAFAQRVYDEGQRSRSLPFILIGAGGLVVLAALIWWMVAF